MTPQGVEQMRTTKVTTGNDCAREHEFVLVLSGVSELGPRVMDALFEAGCDDATPSVRFGRVYLTFARVAPTLKEAILSAIRDVRRAGIGASVLYVDDCNLVTQADIARRIKRTRQQVGQYIYGKRGPGHFPGPVCDLAEGHPLWMWCEVSCWLWQNGIVGEDVLEESRAVAVINSVLDLLHQRGHDSDLVEEVFRLVEGESEDRKQGTLF
ncbi:hypothetical protein BH23PLA1_BH23PLA1_16630 [soil metagenome]